MQEKLADVGAALDDIQFSTIPEPNTWALLALGGALLWFAQVRSSRLGRRRGRPGSESRL